jgi:hypothetical protein
MNDEFAWLIEHRNSEISRPQYWAGSGWTYDDQQAVRFARKVDAERVAAGFDEDDPLPSEAPHRICEHAWPAPATATGTVEVAT